MFTPNEEEQQFLNLSTKFRDELAHVDKQITELKDRRDQLLHLLYGPGPVLADEGGVEEENKLALVHSEDYSVVGDTLVKTTHEERVLRLIRKNQKDGTSRAQINKALAKYNLSQVEIGNLLKRLRSAGAIVSEGNARAALWYIAE